MIEKRESSKILQTVSLYRISKNYKFNKNLQKFTKNFQKIIIKISEKSKEKVLLQYTQNLYTSVFPTLCWDVWYKNIPQW